MSLPGDTVQLDIRPLMPAFGVEILDVDIASADRETLSDVIYRLVRRHVHDGRKSLWVSAGIVIRGIIGMPEAEAMDLVDELIAFATQERFVYRHKWQAGDILVWDNRCTLHRGTPFDMENDVRYVRRTWVRGEAPQ